MGYFVVASDHAELFFVLLRRFLETLPRSLRLRIAIHLSTRQPKLRHHLTESSDGSRFAFELSRSPFGGAGQVPNHGRC